LVQCLVREPEIKVGTGGFWSGWFIDGALSDDLKRLPEDRFVDLWPGRR
jgi:hypothetical protein